MDKPRKFTAVETWSGIITLEPDGEELTTPYFDHNAINDGGGPTWFGVYFRRTNGELAHVKDFDTPEEANVLARQLARTYYLPYHDRIIL